MMGIDAIVKLNNQRASESVTALENKIKQALAEGNTALAERLAMQR